ncbi:MAG TPA: hypothetical protein VF230_05190 [Acidimicrobiales bacterium]
MTAVTRGIVRLLLAAAAVVAATSAGAPATAAAQAGGDATLHVGYAGYVQAGKGFPVTVSVRTTRLVRGEVVVDARSPSGAKVRVRLPVEVPGGSAKRFVLAVPAMGDVPGLLTAEARVLDEHGDTVLEADPVTARTSDDRELVGLHPGVRRGDTLPAAAALAVDVGVAEFAAVEESHLAQAPLAIEPLGTLVVPPGELGRMSPPVRRGVLAWLGAGGTLAIDGEPATVDGLPDGWQPGANGAASAGLGRVVHTRGQVLAGRVERLFHPTPQRNAMSLWNGQRTVSGSVAEDAGLRVPDLGWLLVFLLGYTAVVGPIVAIVLNRAGRAELAWVVIPLVAILFTAGSYVGARSLRASTRLAHASVIEVDESGARATTYVGVSARRRHQSTVSLETTWSASRNSSDFRGTGSSQVELTERGPAGDLRLAAGEFAVSTLRGPVDLDGGLQLTASSDADGAATGSIENTMTIALEDVVVTVGDRATSIGRLDPGQSQAWSIGPQSVRAVAFEPMDLPETQLWGERGGFVADRSAAGDAVNTAVWRAASPFGGWARPSGLAIAAGWTRDHDVEVRIGDGRRRPVGRTAIATSVAVKPGGRLTDMTIRGEPLRSSDGGFNGDLGPGRNADVGSVLRFVLPTGAAPTKSLVATVPWAGGAGIEVWDGRWQPVPTIGGGVGVGAQPFRRGENMAQSQVEVPVSAVRDGMVFVRLVGMSGVFRAASFTLSEQP